MLTQNSRNEVQIFPGGNFSQNLQAMLWRRSPTSRNGIKQVICSSSVYLYGGWVGIARNFSFAILARHLLFFFAGFASLFMKELNHFIGGNNESYVLRHS